MTERAMSHDPNAMSAKMLDQINSVDYACIQYNAQADMAGTYIPNNRVSYLLVQLRFQV